MGAIEATENARKRIEKDIRYHENMLEHRRKAATQAIEKGSWWVAATALLDCHSHEQITNELRYQLEALEVEQW